MKQGAPLGLLLCAACASTSPGGARPILEGVAAPETWVRTPAPGALPAVPGPSAWRVSEARLDNGVRVVVVEEHRRAIVKIRLLLGQGAATDPDAARGATFFAVTLLGDLYEEDSDGKAKVGEDSLRKQVWDLGGGLVTGVDADESMLGIDGYAKDTARYLELLGQAVTSPRRGPGTFDARRRAIIDALEEIQVSDEETFFQTLSQTAFGVDHVYARSIYGTIEDLQGIGLDDVIDRQTALLHPRNATLLVVGDVTSSAVIAEAGKSFARWTRRTRAARPAVAPPEVTRIDEVVVIPQPEAEGMAICAARPIVEPKTSDAAIELLAALMGGGADSRLAKALRHDAALAYWARAEVVRRRHARALLACTRVPKQGGGSALGIFVKALDALRANAPSESELELAKAVTIAEIESERGDMTSAVAAWIEQVSLGERAAARERIAAIRSVTADQVHQLARRILDPKYLQVLLAGDPITAKKAVTANGLGRVEYAKAIR